MLLSSENPDPETALMPERLLTNRHRRMAGRAVCGLLMLALAAMLAGCGTNQKDKLRTETIDSYASLMRWSQYDSLIDFMHPEYLEENPIRGLDLERLRQFQVSEYRVRQMLSLDDGSGMDRVVQMRLYHVHTRRERSIQYLETWRWDDEREGWFLHSGLPDVTTGR